MDAEMVSESIPGNNEDPNCEESDVIMENEAEEDEDVDSEEYVALNDQIDELNDALDSIEKKNDNIHAQLLELLKCSKQFRKEIQERVSENETKEAN